PSSCSSSCSSRNGHRAYSHLAEGVSNESCTDPTPPAPDTPTPVLAGGMARHPCRRDTAGSAAAAQSCFSTGPCAACFVLCRRPYRQVHVLCPGSPGAGSRVGLCRHSVPRPRAVLRAGRLCPWHVPDACG